MHLLEVVELLHCRIFLDKTHTERRNASQNTKGKGPKLLRGSCHVGRLCGRGFTCAVWYRELPSPFPLPILLTLTRDLSRLTSATTRSTLFFFYLLTRKSSYLAFLHYLVLVLVREQTCGYHEASINSQVCTIWGHGLFQWSQCQYCKFRLGNGKQEL